LLKKKNKQKKTYLPTVGEFLTYIPVRKDYKWFVNEEGLVQIIIPKFTGSLGKSFCKIIKKGDTFTANMDKIGTVVWTNCDGKKSVQDILEELKKEFPEEDEIDQRLFLFLQQMKALNYLDY
jgi:hypothetical protein